MVPLFHGCGEGPCGGVAFRVAEALLEGKEYSPGMIEMPDGTQPDPGAKMQCGTCGLGVGLRDLTVSPEFMATL